MDQLKELGFKDLGYLMNPGIYVLCLQGEIVYVGQTINIFNRLSSTDHIQRAYDKIYFIKCNMADLDRVEALMILKFKPSGNQAYNLNKNTDHRNRPTVHGSGQAIHTITVAGTKLSLAGRRRV